MFFARWFSLLAIISLPSLAMVSMEQKQARVQSLKKLSDKIQFVSFDAYERDLEYEMRGLSINERVGLETNLLSTQIKEQVCKAYDAALVDGLSSSEAIDQVKATFMKDLELAADDIRLELQVISLQVLEDCSKGMSISEPTPTPILNKRMLKLVKERSEFLNEEEGCCDDDQVMGYPVTNRSKDALKTEYASKQELIDSLTSDRESARWVTTANQTLKTSKVKKNDTKISAQVGFSFLGAKIEGGPFLTFKREFSSSAFIMAEGIRPVLLDDGNFDLRVRDRNGVIVKKGGKDQRRFVSFMCEVEVKYETEIGAGAELSYMNAGIEHVASGVWENSVNIDSRRIALPEYVAEKTVTVKYISDLCNNDFMNARSGDSYMTIKQSLDVSMRNLVKGLVYSHSKTKCAVDNDCMGWFYNSVFTVNKSKIQPRCVEEPREKFRYCIVKGLSGQKCPLFDASSQRISDGMFEFNCDQGLKCVQTRKGGWFVDWELYQYPEAQCKPINPKTYRRP